jgi:regulator of sigma E protease
MGHFLAARAFGIRVTKFYLFFDAWGTKLFSFKWGETEFGVGWLPFGGYCQISGMIDETQGADDMASTPQPWEFRSKPAWQRLIVLFGGIFLNFVLGVFILSMLLLRSPNGYLSNDEVSRHGGITPSPVAQEIGFQTGDQILKINGRRVIRFQDAASMNVLLGADITVLRGSDTLTIAVPRNTFRRVMEEEMPFFRANNFPVVVENMLEGSIAERMGMLAKDRILQINTDTIHSFEYLQRVLRAYRNEDIQLSVYRDAEVIFLHTTLDSTARLGIFVNIPLQPTDYTFSTAFMYGYRDALDLLKANTRGIGKIFSGEVRATESVQGPIGMAQIYGSKWIWSRFWYITGLLSLILAFMNFLPIPALDGGHIMFTLWEIITRRIPSDRFLVVAQQIGMAIILALMLFAVSNDLLRIFR